MKKNGSISEKMLTGIVGFDEISDGGLPRGRTTLVIGGPGSGKTIFALQSLVNGANKCREAGIFVAFEEVSGSIQSNASKFGWDLPGLEREKLFFLDAQLSPTEIHAGDFDLTGLLAGIKKKAEAMHAKRIVFDGIDVLLMLLRDPAAEQREIYRLHEWLRHSGMTGIVTAKSESNVAQSQQYGFMQFMADSVVFFRHRLKGNIALRSVRMLKCRGSNISTDEHPFVIGPKGIEILSFGPIGLVYKVSSERVSAGAERLDSMLGGGYFRGSSILISGVPGTAKSTLAGAFARAACKRSERTIYISFDEGADQIVRNFSSVGINLAPYVKSKMLMMYSVRTESLSAEAHCLKIKALVEEHNPRCIVVDPISALAKAGGLASAIGVIVRLLALTKQKGITILFTKLSSGESESGESATQIQVSTIADTWIHLSYVIRGGERNRALTIIKSRGTKHSNQVRELILSDKGIDLTDVYSAGGEVLMGTARWEKEASEKFDQDLLHSEASSKRVALKLLEVEAASRIETVKHELAARRAELTILVDAEQVRESQWMQKKKDVSARRNGGRNH